MELSIFVAKVLAISYISVGIGMLIWNININKLYEDFEKSQALILISGYFTLILGALLVQYHNIWTNDWRMLITVIGWLCLVKGIILIIFPKVLFKFKNIYTNVKLWWVFIILIWLWLGYLGFTG